MRKRLTDRTLITLRAASGKRYEVWDLATPGLGVRVNSAGRKVFVLSARYPGRTHFERRRLGEYPIMTLAEARSEAERWKRLVTQGIDPKADRARAQANTFARVAEDYFAHPHRQGRRRRHEVERAIRRVFIPIWGDRHITTIDRSDVRAMINATVARGKEGMAYLLLAYIRRLFNWAIDQDVYGIDRSPCDRLRPASIIGKRTARTRILSETELRALWLACERIGYPFGPFVQLLTLTGQRRSEVAEAEWSEFDLDHKLWAIPPERMKMATPHIVPLSDDVVTLLNALPRFGRYLFTYDGERPITIGSNLKKRLDHEMQRELGTLQPFRLHDLRRTCRTMLPHSLTIFGVPLSIALQYPRTILSVPLSHSLTIARAKLFSLRFRFLEPPTLGAFSICRSPLRRFFVRFLARAAHTSTSTRKSSAAIKRHRRFKLVAHIALQFFHGILKPVICEKSNSTVESLYCHTSSLLIMMSERMYSNSSIAKALCALVLPLKPGSLT